MGKLSVYDISLDRPYGGELCYLSYAARHCSKVCRLPRTIRCWQRERPALWQEFLFLMAKSDGTCLLRSPGLCTFDIPGNLECEKALLPLLLAQLAWTSTRCEYCRNHDYHSGSYVLLELIIQQGICRLNWTYTYIKLCVGVQHTVWCILLGSIKAEKAPFLLGSFPLDNHLLQLRKPCQSIAKRSSHCIIPNDVFESYGLQTQILFS